MTRFTKHRPLMRASVHATVVASVGFASALPAPAADEVTHDRLLNADKEPANWLHHTVASRCGATWSSRTRLMAG
jgi:alcohol dehydrogenase (cytochrome c)